MITARSIKLRFGKRHLLRLVNDMLKWTCNKGGEKVDRLIIKPGWTPESIVSHIGIVSLEEQTWDTKNHQYHALKLQCFTSYRGFQSGKILKSTPDPIYFHFPDSDLKSIQGPPYNLKEPAEYLDLYIQDRLLCRDLFFYDNSAIPVFL